MRQLFRYSTAGFSVLRLVPNEVWAEALMEVATTTFYSSIPLLLGTVFYYFFQGMDLRLAVRAVLVQGEFAVMAASSIGPILYLVTKRRDFRFPLSTLFGLANSLLLAVGTIAFIHSKIVGSNGPRFWSIFAAGIIYLLSLILTFLATAISNTDLDAAAIQKANEEHFNARFDSNHG